MEKGESRGVRDWISNGKQLQTMVIFVSYAERSKELCAASGLSYLKEQKVS